MDNSLLNDRMGSLKEWEQEESLNEILYNTLSELNAYTKERFDELTREIRDEAVLNYDEPAIKVAVCTKENIDKQLFLFPVSTEPPINSPGYITTIFAECDYLTIQEMMLHTYAAEIVNGAETLQTRVSLRYSSKYLQKLKSLYYVFSENGLPWRTVNGIYFYKFLDVYGTQDTAQEITGFNIDFAQYEKYISYDKALLWNISPITAAVAACEAKPAYNAVQFEHTLKNLQLDENRYLFCPFGDKFTSFRRGQTMYVRTNTLQLEQFRLLRITGGEDADSLLYLKPKSNKKKPGFIDSLAMGRYIPTRGEAERIVRSFTDETGITLADIEVLPSTEENILLYKGVDYNLFIETNSFLAEKKLLLFTFEVDADSLWAHEIMFFVLSELQLNFYEYRCVGKLL